MNFQESGWAAGQHLEELPLPLVLMLSGCTGLCLASPILVTNWLPCFNFNTKIT